MDDNVSHAWTMADFDSPPEGFEIVVFKPDHARKAEADFYARFEVVWDDFRSRVQRLAPPL